MFNFLLEFYYFITDFCTVDLLGILALQEKVNVMLVNFKSHFPQSKLVLKLTHIHIQSHKMHWNAQ